MNVEHRRPGELSGSTGNNFELRLCVLVFFIFSEITAIARIRIREGVKKNPYLFGTLSQTSDPTHPPRTFGTKS